MSLNEFIACMHSLYAGAPSIYIRSLVFYGIEKFQIDKRESGLNRWVSISSYNVFSVPRELLCRT